MHPFGNTNSLEGPGFTLLLLTSAAGFKVHDKHGKIQATRCLVPRACNLCIDRKQ